LMFSGLSPLMNTAPNIRNGSVIQREL